MREPEPPLLSLLPLTPAPAPCSRALLQHLKNNPHLEVGGRVITINLLNIKFEQVKALEENANNADSATGITLFASKPPLAPPHKMHKRARARLQKAVEKAANGSSKNP